MFGKRCFHPAGALLGLVALLSVCSVASAAYRYPPGPPFRYCPDSVSIYQAQMSDTTINPCFPSLDDTLFGMKGIVCGFRLRSTGRIYMENSNAADYNGIQVYTQGHMETQGIALGDSISVCGLRGQYQLENQIGGRLGTNLTVRRISGPHPLPPFRVGTTTTFKWSPVPANHPGIPSVGSLVKVTTPLRVARRGPGAGLPGNQNYLCVRADGGAPGDSLQIEGYTLTASDIIAPPLGYTVNWVQGILRRASPGGVDYLVISLRDANDVSVAGPPNLSDAFPIAENKLRLIFDKNLDEDTAEDPANYVLGSGSSGSNVTNATVVVGSPNMVDLTITEVLARLTQESILAQDIGSADCPACLMEPQSRTFILGVLSCLEVQTPRADSLAGDPCLDKSRFAGNGTAWGTRVTVRGIMMKEYGVQRLFHMQDAVSGPRSGVVAYNVPFGMQVGRQYLLACAVQEYYGMTELSNPVALIDEGPATVPAPQLQTIAVLTDLTCDPYEVTANAEDYEGVLVRVENAKVVPFNTEPRLPSPGGSFRIAGPAPSYPDTILVSNYNQTYTTATAVDTGAVVNVNGMLYVDQFASRIYPRDDSDIEFVVHIVEVDSFPISFARVDVSGAVSELGLALRGPTMVHVALDQIGDGNGDGREEVPTEMTQLDLSGLSCNLGPVFVRLRPPDKHPNQRSVGEIIETANTQAGRLDLPPFAPAGSADSFFDIFFEIEIPSVGMVLHNDVPKRMSSLIHHKPPEEGATYEDPVAIPLLDEYEHPTGIMIRAKHTPVPPIERDLFNDSEAIVELLGPGGVEPISLRGPTRVNVDTLAVVDEDCDGYEQVPTEMVQLDLSGTSSFGPVQIRLRNEADHPHRRTLGEIEETANLTPFRLDLRPFVSRDTTTAVSFFDVYFEVEIPSAGMILHNHDSKRMTAVIHHKPPERPDFYVSPPDSETALYDQLEQLTPFRIRNVIHYPVRFLGVPTELPPRTLALRSVWPNPGARAISITWALPRRAKTRLIAYDVSGRVVRRLVEGVFDAGVRGVVWDGRDAAGRKAPAGVYFLRLESEGYTAARRVVMIE
jgi:hypothetical protein